MEAVLYLLKEKAADVEEATADLLAAYKDSVGALDNARREFAERTWRQRAARLKELEKGKRDLEALLQQCGKRSMHPAYTMVFQFHLCSPEVQST